MEPVHKNETWNTHLARAYLAQQLLCQRCNLQILQLHFSIVMENISSIIRPLGLNQCHLLLGEVNDIVSAMKFNKLKIMQAVFPLRFIDFVVLIPRSSRRIW
jgi:hypothetical protein